MTEAENVMQLERDLKMLMGITSPQQSSSESHDVTSNIAALPPDFRIQPTKPAQTFVRREQQVNGPSVVEAVEKATNGEDSKPAQAKHKKLPKPSLTKNEDPGLKPASDATSSDTTNQPAKPKTEKKKKRPNKKGNQNEKAADGVETEPKGTNHPKESEANVQVLKQAAATEKVNKKISQPGGSTAGPAPNPQVPSTASSSQSAKVQIKRSKANKGEEGALKSAPPKASASTQSQPAAQVVKQPIDNNGKSFKNEKKGPTGPKGEKKTLTADPQVNPVVKKEGVDVADNNKMGQTSEKMTIKVAAKPLNDTNSHQLEPEKPIPVETKTVELPAALLQLNQEANYTGTDGEEWVRVIVLPPKKPSPTAEKKLMPRSESEKAEAAAEDSDSDDNSDSSASSSQEEEQKEKPAQASNQQQPQQQQQQTNQQPLVLNIRKKELDSFRQRGVMPLRHISPKFTRAIFHCRLCSFHISSVPEVYRHVKDDRHVRLQTQEQSRQTAILMPLPPADIMDVVGNLIQDLFVYSRLMPEELELRRTCTEILRQLVEVNFPGITIRPYGSCLTELGMRGAAVNVGVVKIDPEGGSPPGMIIIAILNWLHNNPIWAKLNEDFSCSVPVIRFEHKQLGVPFALVIESENAFKTSVLLQQYRIIDPRFAVLTIAFRNFARICYLDQPELGSLPPHAYTLMVLFYMQHDKVLPVLHEMSPNKDDPDSYLSAVELLKLKAEGKWKPREMSLGHLWLRLLQFYAYSFANNEEAVCVRSSEPLLRSVKNWGNRRIAIEDPFHQNVNLGSPLGSNQTFDFFLECMRNMFHYFWIPQTNTGPLFVHLTLPGDCSDEDPMRCTPEEALRRMEKLNRDDVKWNFEPEKILRSKRLPVVCSVCTGEGHTKTSCPELEVPKVGYIPPPDLQYFALLDNVCWNVFRNFAQREIDQTNRQTIRKELEEHIRKEFADAELTLFGSSCNGFGFSDSDLDLCLTFKSNDDGKGLDFVDIVKKLAKMLRRNKFFSDIVPISSAKVPIVKLRHRSTGLESDISLYNQLGRRNSQLLATYSAIDSRVRILGYMAKLLAKQCDIGDASRGSLSSYGYTLLVLHYLQQVTPPVIPVLQEITVNGVDRTKYIVEGWDTWFYEDSQNLGQVWPHQGANREPPSTLWLGFLLYYAELFNYRQQVVCIRQHKPLYRLEKMWTERPIAIEDPFNLKHNLGSGISMRMGAYIRRVFVMARRFFQTPVRSLPPNFGSLEEYLFNPKVLVPNGPPPNDRGCIICGKIGHKAKECEWRRGGANRNKNRGNTNDRQQQQPDNRARQQQQRPPPHRQQEQQVQNPRAMQLQQHINQERAAYQQQQNRYRPAQQRPANEMHNRYRQQQQQAQHVNNRPGQANSNLIIRERIVVPSVKREPEANQPKATE